ncbi:peroxisomal biogenesis factor 19-like isoform X2 [Limulus polyphemus]|uniref:Peroxin-19 n=1 Tax=Limulus polyphemus TaxID=6850 RepID=A0ABM1BBJ1_LIMPO|nr:peroxisomal biogenesis factor 19-like isoform X2 [Limulus polyphemus]
MEGKKSSTENLTANDSENKPLGNNTSIRLTTTHLASDSITSISTNNDVTAETEGTNNIRTVDEELDALLDSALEDFSKPLQKICSEKPKPSENEKYEKQNIGSSGAIKPSPDKTSQSFASSSKASTKGNAEKKFSTDHPWGLEFQQFEEAMKKLLDEDPALKSQLDQLTDSTACASSDEEFTASLAETLKGLAENTQSINEPPSESEVTQLLSALGMAAEASGDSGDGTGLLNLMHSVMQNLLSRDLLYPALQDVIRKYPNWLAEKKDSLEEQQYEKYSHQLEIMKQVCQEFEAEKDDDSSEIKKARFERILALMHKMQDCGHPPKEISPVLEFDEQGNIKMPELPNQNCCIM